ncbi:MAG: Ku protein [Polaromonas sp.]
MTSRASWKGAISFGLVYIPVALHPATSASGVDFDWLDKRSMDPVGYQRINKKTGKEVITDDIVKAVAHGEGRYVVVSEEEINAATPKATQTIDIDSFVPLADIPMAYLERPYYMVPIDKSAKAYALLRSTLQATNKAALAQVVIQNKQHLAVVLASGPGLVLILLRWTEDLRSWQDLEVELPPQDAKAAGLSERELALARQLVEELSGPWNPAGFVDTFKRDIMALVERKASQGQLHTVPNPSLSPEASPDARNKVKKAGKAETPAPKAAAKKRSPPDPHKI